MFRPSRRFVALAAALAAMLTVPLTVAPARAVTFPNLTKLTPAAGWQTPNYGAHYGLAQTGEQFSAAAVGDLDGNGVPDVVAGFPAGMGYAWRLGTGARWVQAWHLNGQELPGFPVGLKDTSWSSPAVADVDGDGWPEIVFGFDCDGVPGQDCYPQRGGYVGVVRHDGSWQPGWPRFYPGQVIW